MKVVSCHECGMGICVSDEYYADMLVNWEGWPMPDCDYCWAIYAQQRFEKARMNCLKSHGPNRDSLLGEIDRRLMEIDSCVASEISNIITTA